MKSPPPSVRLHRNGSPCSPHPPPSQMSLRAVCTARCGTRMLLATACGKRMRATSRQQFTLGIWKFARTIPTVLGSTHSVRISAWQRIHAAVFKHHSTLADSARFSLPFLIACCSATDRPRLRKVREIGSSCSRASSVASLCDKAPSVTSARPIRPEMAAGTLAFLYPHRHAPSRLSCLLCLDQIKSCWLTALISYNGL